MNWKIRFSHATVKQLQKELRIALQTSDIRRIKHLMGLLAMSQGQPVSEVADQLGVCSQTIYNWMHAFVLCGWESLCTRAVPGRPSKLTGTQKRRLCELITAGPEACGYETGCWNSALIQDMIQREFGRTYNVHYLSCLLSNLGFSYQKARFVSDHLDPVARQKWITETFPAIVKEARDRGALLLFGDEASFAQWGSLSYTWAPCGKQPVIKTCGKRKAYKVMGMIDYFSGRLFYQGQTERFNSERYCSFLKSVLSKTTQPIMVIQDGARYHTSKATKAFVAAQGARLRVYQLPSYSPDYNPIEHLWRNVKRNKTHNRYFPSFEGLIAEVEVALTEFQEKPENVKQLMGTHLEKALDIARAA